MKNIKVRDFALKFLRESITAVVATSTTDGNPHAAVIYFYVDDDFNFYFLTAHNTRKYENLMQNPKISLTVGFGPPYITIQGRGKAELLENNSDEESAAIVKIDKRLYSKDYRWPLFEISRFKNEKLYVFKIIPSELTLLNLDKDNNLTTYRDDFQKII